MFWIRLLLVLACTTTFAETVVPQFCAATRSVFINEIAPYDQGDLLFSGVTVEVAGLAGMDLQGWALIFYDSTGRCVGAEGANTDKQDGVGTCPITQFFTKSRSTMVPDTQAGWGTLIIQEEGLLGGTDGNGGGGGGNGGGGGGRGMGMGSAAAAVALLDLDGAVSEF
eukprot:gene7030-10327_t